MAPNGLCIRHIDEVRLIGPTREDLSMPGSSLKITSHHRDPSDGEHQKRLAMAFFLSSSQEGLHARMSYYSGLPLRIAYQS